MNLNVGRLGDPPIDRLNVEVVLEDGTLSQIKDADRRFSDRGP
jgi:hypothetical protein